MGSNTSDCFWGTIPRSKRSNRYITQPGGVGHDAGGMVWHREREGRGFHWKLMLTLNLLYLFNLTSEGIYLIWLFAPLFSVFKYLIEKWRVSGRIIFWVTYLALIFIHWRRFQITQNGRPRNRLWFTLVAHNNIFRLAVV